MLYELGWTTLPGLRGLSCSEFRAAPAQGQGGGVVLELADQNRCRELLRRLEEHFAARRFTNAAEAFDTVKAYALEQAAAGG